MATDHGEICNGIADVDSVGEHAMHGKGGDEAIRSVPGGQGGDFMETGSQGAKLDAKSVGSGEEEEKVLQNGIPPPQEDKDADYVIVDNVEEGQDWPDSADKENGEVLQDKAEISATNSNVASACSEVEAADVETRPNEHVKGNAGAGAAERGIVVEEGEVPPFLETEVRGDHDSKVEQVRGDHDSKVEQGEIDHKSGTAAAVGENQDVLSSQERKYIVVDEGRTSVEEEDHAEASVEEDRAVANVEEDHVVAEETGKSERDDLTAEKDVEDNTSKGSDGIAHDSGSHEQVVEKVTEISDNVPEAEPEQQSKTSGEVSGPDVTTRSDDDENGDALPGVEANGVQTVPADEGNTVAITATDCDSQLASEISTAAAVDRALEIESSPDADGDATASSVPNESNKTDSSRYLEEEALERVNCEHSYLGKENRVEEQDEAEKALSSDALVSETAEVSENLEKESVVEREDFVSANQMQVSSADLVQLNGSDFAQQQGQFEEVHYLEDAAFNVGMQSHIDEHVNHTSGSFGIMFGCYNGGSQNTDASSTHSSSPPIETSQDKNAGLKMPGPTPRKVWHLVRIPRHTDNKLKADIRLAQIQVNDKTEKRDFIRTAIQMKRAKKDQLLASLRAARDKERGVHDAIRTKRQEMEPVKLRLMKFDNANTVKEYDAEIKRLEYLMQVETFELKEEKQMMATVKNLKAERAKLIERAGLSSNCEEAFEDISVHHERSKLLKQELDSLRRLVAEEDKLVKAVEKELNELNAEIKQLHGQWQAADAVRQEAYESLRTLKKQEYDMNTDFYQSRNDSQMARQYAQAGDMDSLEQLCNSQIERLLLKWNSDVEFRKAYIKDNERSTLKRLGTLDGRSLGPDEEPPVLSNLDDEFGTFVKKQEKQPVPIISDRAATSAKEEKEEPFKANLHEQSSVETAVPKKKPGKPKKPQAEPQLLFDLEPVLLPPAPKENSLVETEEEEMIRKEKIRQEEKQKAKAAEERKRKKSERKRDKEIAWAQREAERKEKKKANKKSAAVASPDKVEDQTVLPSNLEGGGSTDTVNNANEVSLPEQKSVTQRKKSVPQKKSKPVFPGSRRSKRVWQRWIWAIVAVCFCLVAIFLWFNF